MVGGSVEPYEMRPSGRYLGALRRSLDPISATHGFLLQAVNLPYTCTSIVMWCSQESPHQNQADASALPLNLQSHKLNTCLDKVSQPQIFHSSNSSWLIQCLIRHLCPLVGIVVLVNKLRAYCDSKYFLNCKPDSVLPLLHIPYWFYIANLSDLHVHSPNFPLSTALLPPPDPATHRSPDSSVSCSLCTAFSTRIALFHVLQSSQFCRNSLHRSKSSLK